MKSFYKAGSVLCLLPATPLQLFSIFTRRAFSRFLPCCIFLLLFGLPDARSQSPEKQEAVSGGEIQPLRVGDTIPEELWHMPLQVVNHPEGKESITLGDYKDKLIILDFWATWCAPCIKGFPKLNKLQNEFGDKVKILSVTTEDKEKIYTFFNTGAGKEHPYINSVVDDKVLSTYFPYKTVPHVVWITPKGKIFNTTTAESLTDANIQAILQNQEISMVAKVDIDRNRPLFLSEHFGEDMELKSYSIFAKGYYPGLPAGTASKSTKEGEIYSRQATNLPMMDIYRPIARDLFAQKEERFNHKRLVLDVENPSLLSFIIKEDGSVEYHNLYNYEMIVPEDKVDSLSHYVLEYLNEYSDYIGSIEKRLVDCFILVRTSREDKIKSKGGKIENTFPHSPSVVRNSPIRSMISRLINHPSINHLIIDETGYPNNVDIEIPSFDDLASLKRELNKYHLDLLPTKRELSMFVLRDK